MATASNPQLDFMSGTLPRDFARGPRPLYRHLVTLVEAAIARGELPSGARVPPERDLARRLRVSRTTIVNAYRELEARGLLRGYVGRGTFVCAAPEPAGTPFAWRGKVAAAALRASDTTLRDLCRDSADPRLISFAAGMPAVDLFPTQAFQRAVDQVLREDADATWRPGPTEGQPRLRKAIAERFGVPAAGVMVVSGAQQGLDLLARCLIDPGDAVVMDRPGYLGAIQTFRSAGARLVGWDVSRADVDELEDLVLRYRPKLIYTNPSFQNPSGATLPLRGRKDLLGLAERYRVPIVEDGTYQELFFESEPPPPLHRLNDHQLVIHLNSFSKVLAPGLRLGWLAAAETIVDQLTLLKQRVDPHTQNLTQFAIARLIENGRFDDHLKAIRAEHRRRASALAAAFDRHLPAGALRFGRPQGGLYFWCRLEPGLKARAVLQHALQAGVVFVNGEAFYVDQAGDESIRLCFSSLPQARAEEGARRLGAAVRAAQHTKPAARSVVPIA